MTNSKTQDLIAKAARPFREAGLIWVADATRYQVTQTLALLEKHAWDMNAAYPRTRGQTDTPARAFALSLVQSKNGSRRPHEPYLVVARADAETRAVAEAQDALARDFDAWEYKLAAKVGDVEAVTLATRPGTVWDHSVLKVRKADGTEELWLTRPVRNMSKLGKFFMQFPSRKIKRMPRG